jgi:hypothetical protein
MGRYTHFYGKLEFKRPMDEGERRILEWIIDGPSLIGNEAYGEYLRTHNRSGARRDNDLDNERIRAVCDERIRAAGFTRIEDRAFADAMRVLEDGLVYAGEKTYDLVSGMNFIIENARRRIAGFGLKGQLYAETEFEPYEWLLKINSEGWAEQVPCDFDALPESEKKIIADGEKEWQDAWHERCRRLDAKGSPLRRVWTWGLSQFRL